MICGKTPSTKIPENYGDDIPFITIPDMHNNVYIAFTERSLSKLGADSQSNKYLPANSVCVSCIGTAGLTVLTSEPSQTNQQINSIIPRDGVSPYYVYLLMRTLAPTIQTLGTSKGTTFPNLSKGEFAKIPVKIPDSETMRAFSGIVEPMFKLILANMKQNTQLAEARDTLLPNLMSGELDVSDIEL